jgi:DNA-binding CsgD family transcriptional regulator
MDQRPGHGAGAATAMAPVLAEIYNWVLQNGQISHAEVDAVAVDLELEAATVEAGFAGLMNLHLLRESSATSGQYLPASPEAAMADLVNPIEIEIKERQQRAETLRFQLSALSQAYFKSRQLRNRLEAIDVIDDVGRIRAMLTDTANRCRVEIFSAHPGIFSEVAIAGSLTQDLDLLARGVRMRAIYQHPVRVNGRMREFLGQLTRAGCEVHTTAEIADRVVIFDREVAVIPNRLGPNGAIVLREPSVVDYLYRALELVWASSLPLARDPSEVPGYGAAAGDEVKRAIMRQLCAGAKDDFIARRLSMSVRTCRRHIAEIMEMLGADSRFQAGALAVRHGLLDPSPTDRSDHALDPVSGRSA